MRLTRVFLASAIVLWTLASVHLTGVYLSWYERFAWFDLLTHLQGGVWLGMILLYLAIRSGVVAPERVRSSHTRGLVLAGALVVGLLWEGYEVVVWQVTRFGIPADYLTDTFLDLGMDMLGALVGYLIARTIWVRGSSK